VILGNPFVPRAFGWIGLVLAVAGVATSVSFDVAVSELGGAPYLLSGTWVLVLSGVLAVRGPRFAVNAPPPAVPVAA
jgi:hypothetical protein